MDLNPSNTPCPHCGSTECVIDDYGQDGEAVVCGGCGEFVRDLTEDEMDEQDEADAELAADRILERQELEDFEGREFYEDCCDPYDCEYDRGGYDE